MADNLEYVDVYDSLVIIRDFINNSYSGVSGSPIEDPWETATSKTRSYLAEIDDENLSIARFPKVTIAPLDPLVRERIGGGKSQYRERHTYNIKIMYTCERSAVWTYDGISYKGKHQCRKYLQYLGNKLKQYSGSFEEFNELVIGGVSNIITSPDALKYSGVLSIKLDSYSRI